MNAPTADPFWIWLLLKVVAVATAFAGFNKYVVKPFKHSVIRRASEFYSKVNFITTELRPNGGSTMRDIIDRTHDVVNKVDQRHRNFLQLEPNGIFESDAKGDITWVNRAYLDIVRRHPDDILGAAWRSIIADRDRARVVNEWLSAVGDSRDFFIRLTVVDSEGHDIPAEIKALRMLTSKGTLLGHLGWLVRLDKTPPGCRWCRAIEELTNENYRLLHEKLERDPKLIAPTPLASLQPPPSQIIDISTET